jgi:hypothetical protein
MLCSLSFVLVACPQTWLIRWLMTKSKRDGHQCDSHEEGDAVRDDQRHIPGCYPVGNPEQDPVSKVMK